MSTASDLNATPKAIAIVERVSNDGIVGYGPLLITPRGRTVELGDETFHRIRRLQTRRYPKADGARANIRSAIKAIARLAIAHLTLKEPRDLCK